MSFIEAIPEVEDALGSVLSLLGLKQNADLEQAINDLYHDTDALATFTIKAVIALYWWAAHVGSATEDAFKYAEQIQAEQATANRHQLEAWQTLLAIKHPAEIRRVYIRTTKRIEVTKKVMAKAQKVNLKPIYRRLAALEKWRRHIVTPALKSWSNFHRLWRSTYLPAVRVIIRWRKHPADFAQWAIMPLIVAAPKALRKKAAKRSATAIEAALVNTWRNDPGTIYDSILEWLVTG